MERNNTPILDAVTPFPIPDKTPPVTTTILRLQRTASSTRERSDGVNDAVEDDASYKLSSDPPPRMFSICFCRCCCCWSLLRKKKRVDGTIGALLGDANVNNGDV
eukprot:11541275-Ditylum_brightwellii.AAC.1